MRDPHFRWSTKLVDALDAIRNRRSVKRLGAPAPTAAELAELLELGATAPDHGGLKPWRYLALSGAELERFPLDAGSTPAVIVAGLEPSGGKIPEHEQLAAVAAGCQLMLLAADAMGYGAMWRTGSAASDPEVKRAAGLGPNGSIVAFLHIGTPADGGESSPKVAAATIAADATGSGTSATVTGAASAPAPADDGSLGIGSLRGR